MAAFADYYDHRRFHRASRERESGAHWPASRPRVEPKGDDVNTQERTLPVILIAITIAIAAAAMVTAALLLPARPAQATHVTPEHITGTGNFTCSGFQGAGQTWIELKIDPNADGTFDDVTLEVTITNTTNDKIFDWSSNIGVDAVFVKAGGKEGHNLYHYDPPSEAFSDTDLTSPGPGNQISHISFCYDLPDATPTATPTPTPSATPTAAPTATPTAAPTATVLGEIQEPQTQQPQALPETGAEPPRGSRGYFPLLLAFGGLALLSGASTLLAVAARRRR